MSGRRFASAGLASIVSTVQTCSPPLGVIQRWAGVHAGKGIRSNQEPAAWVGARILPCVGTTQHFEYTLTRTGPASLIQWRADVCCDLTSLW